MFSNCSFLLLPTAAFTLLPLIRCLLFDLRSVLSLLYPELLMQLVDREKIWFTYFKDFCNFCKIGLGAFLKFLRRLLIAKKSLDHVDILSASFSPQLYSGALCFPKAGSFNFCLAFRSSVLVVVFPAPSLLVFLFCQ